MSDITWIKDHEKLINIENNHTPIPMDVINSYIIYINKNDFIEKIICSQMSLETNRDDTVNSTINKNNIIQFINYNKIQTKLTKYKFDTMFLYNIDLKHDDLKSFSNLSNFNNINKRFFKKMSFMSDIIIPPSLFIFHKINSLYLCFKETPIHKNINEPHNLKSILKNNLIKREHHTKKVKFKNIINNKTRKYN
tara:strand:- start:2993 stop:3574 length:582 start_codon:yes stop_codon:yes gene_type:complete